MLDARVRVEGGDELRRLARKVGGPESQKALKAGHKSIAELVADTAGDNTPHRTGALRRTVRGLGSQRKAEVAAGRGRINDYAGVIHYGNPDRGIAAQPFLTDAVSERMSDSRAELEKLYRGLAQQLATR